MFYISARCGNALNSAGTLYIRKATSFLENDCCHSEIEETLNHSIRFLEDGIQCFEKTNNWMNAVILASNAGMAYRTWAYSVKKYSEMPKVTEKERQMHQKSLELYNKAFELCLEKNHEEMVLSAALNLARTFSNILKESSRFENSLSAFLSENMEYLNIVLKLSQKIQSNRLSWRPDVSQKILGQFFDIGSLLLWKIHEFDSNLREIIVKSMKILSFNAMQIGFDVKSPTDTFKAWSMNLIFEELQNSCPDPVVNLTKNLTIYKQRRNISIHTDELSTDISNFEDEVDLKKYVDLLSTLEFKKDEKTKVILTSIKEISWSYENSLIVSSHLMTKLFKSAYAQIMQKDTHSKDTLEWLKDRIKDLLKLKEGKNFNVEAGIDLIKIMNTVMINFERNMYENIKDSEGADKLRDKVKEAVNLSLKCYETA